jgi:hypothetical protein
VERDEQARIEAMSLEDLGRGVKAIDAKGPGYAKLERYLDGDHPLVYMASRLKEIFPQLDARFSLNFCEVVAGALLERINLRGFKAADTTTTTELAALWEDRHLGVECDLVHEAAVTTGEAFVIVWPDATGKPEIFAQQSGACHVAYDDEHPTLRAWAVKRWFSEALDRWRVQLYYPDHIEAYQSTGKDLPSATSGYAFMFEERNPFGIVPVFHFKVHGRKAKSDLRSVVPVQDMINKLCADMMVSSEFGSFKQRWKIGGAQADGLQNGPDVVWDLPGAREGEQPVGVGEFSAADLAQFLAAIDKFAGYVAAITRTPLHYFLGGGGQVSGEALIALEAPVTKKAQDRIDRFGMTWREVMAFAERIAQRSVQERDITPLFDRPETVQPRTSAEISEIRVRTGWPLRSALRHEGLSEEQVEQIEKDRAAQKAAEDLSLGQALIRMERANRQAQRNSGAPIPPDEDEVAQ